jgi:hypothetical protein
MEEDDEEIITPDLLNMESNSKQEDIGLARAAANTQLKPNQIKSNRQPHLIDHTEYAASSIEDQEYDVNSGGIGRVTRAQVIESNHLRAKRNAIYDTAPIPRTEEQELYSMMENISNDDEKVNGNSGVEVDSDKWKTLAQSADIYEITPLLMSKYIKSALEEDGLDPMHMTMEVPESGEVVKAKSKTKTIKYYNIQLVIAAGFRVKGAKGQQFRSIATKIMTDNYLG